MREYVCPFIIQKKLASVIAPVATSHARKNITSLFLLSPDVLSSKMLNFSPIGQP